MSSTAAAPSLRVEALAAVTVPSLVKAAFRPAIFSNCTLVYSSSSLTTVSLPRIVIVTGTISSFFLAGLRSGGATLVALARKGVLLFACDAVVGWPWHRPRCP